MEPKDKFGNKIRLTIYHKMLNYGQVLHRHGYTESSRKPNLFYKHTGEVHRYGLHDYTAVTFFADMRGTQEVPIWEDPSPLLYAQFTHNPPRWLKRRLLSQEFEEIGICRFSFFEQHDPDGLMFGGGGDGYCKVCGKDFENDGSFCCPHCEEADKELGKVRCQVCGQNLDYKQVIQHHLSYAEDRLIEVCRSCHGKIHRGSKLPSLKSVDKRR